MQGNVLSPLVDSATRSNKVTSALREAILDGGLKPGELLIERQLAQMLGVSKTPVREALISLTSTGLVVSSANRGVSVREMTAAEVKEVYEVRLLLEPWAVGRTAKGRSTSTVDKIRAALSRTQGLLADDASGEVGNTRLRQLSLANRSFHRELYLGCGNELIIRRLDELQDLTALSTLSILWKYWPTSREEYAEHCSIFQMIEKGNYESAERFAREHIQNSLNRLSG